MDRAYTEAEIATAERMNIDVGYLRLILNTYSKECGRLNKERRARLVTNAINL